MLLTDMMEIVGLLDRSILTFPNYSYFRIASIKPEVSDKNSEDSCLIKATKHLYFQIKKLHRIGYATINRKSHDIQVLDGAGISHIFILF
jgi:hypothetical protein